MAKDFLAIETDGTCRTLENGGGSSPGSGAGGGNVRITASVGINGRNLKPDVETIQRALNDVPANQGRPSPILVVDGDCGSKTKNAIQQFQLKHFGWSGADGRVDPNKQTIAKLNELTRGQRQQEENARVNRVTELLAEVFRCIRTAQMNLLMAANAVDAPDVPSPLPSFSREERMRLANRHFSIDNHPAARRHDVLRQVLFVYDTMMQVFQRPGGVWGAYIFSPDPLNKPHSAYVMRGGGYAAPGDTETRNGVVMRKDSIYLCSRMNMITDEMRVYIVVHELAHFVGNSPEIIDHAYGWHDDPRMQRLTLAQKLLNANNYNNFAFDATHGRKPNGHY